MTNHRVTDLFYGHLGELTYDSNESKWVWSRALNNVQAAVLQPFDRYALPSIQHIPEEAKRPSRIARENLRWITKNHPEVFPANLITAELGATYFDSDLEPSSRVGSLLAVGHAYDYASASGSRRPQIMAMPCGEAGQALKLIRPRYRSLGWGPQSAALIQIIGPESTESGQWVGTGGRILQISFAEDVNKSSAWLAVRQTSAITIFRPLYSKLPMPNRVSSMPFDLATTSSIIPNPVAVLTADTFGSQCLVDVSFNPWYSRQLAVVDELGSCSIWDIEGHVNNMSNLKLLRGSSWKVSDDGAADPAPPSRALNHDGWHRIFWAFNVTTIVVCNRRDIAVFDVKAKPRRLKSCDLLGKSSMDAILDVKRSSTSLNHIFVLTTSRIFWIEISPPTHEKDTLVVSPGAKVLLSYRHYRDGRDDTLKLTTVNDQRVSVVISTSNGLIMDLYCFDEGLGITGRPSALHTSLSLPRSLSNYERLQTPLQTLCFLPVPLKLNSRHRNSGPELRYIHENVKFYQALALAPDLSLLSTPCAVYDGVSMRNRSSIRNVIPPTTLSRLVKPASSRYIVDEPFIIPESVVNESALFDPYSGSIEASLQRAPSTNRRNDDKGLLLNWSYIFRRIFLKDDKIKQNSHHTDQNLSSTTVMAASLQSIENIYAGRGVKVPVMSTLLDIAGEVVTENLDQFALTMNEFLDSIKHDKSYGSSLNVVNISHKLLPSSSSNPGVMEIYDKLVDIWIASLPLEVSGMSRLSKFRLVRKIAIELYLSSIALSPNITLPDTEETDSLPGLKIKESLSRDSTPALFSSHHTMEKPRAANLNLLTPAHTHSVYSSKTNTTREDQPEDPAISRLRVYAVSIASQTAGPNSRLLSHWPSEPGVDPSQYSWAAANGAFAAANNTELFDHRARREEARRRKRTEKFLNRVKEADTEPSSLSEYLQTGSQPDIPHRTLSSQAVEDQPMTQPDRGAFGSRAIPKAVKKKKQSQRRAAGF